MPSESRAGLARLAELVAAVGVAELAGRDVEGDVDVVAGPESGLGDRLHHHVERVPVALEVRREAALVAHAGRQPALLEDRAQRMEDLGARPQRLAERGKAHRHDHELLEVHVGVGVRAAVEDVHHRHRQAVAAGGAGQRRDVGVERQPGGLGAGLEGGHRDAEQRVGAEPALGGRAVERDHRLVEPALLPVAVDQRGRAARR